MTSETRLLAFLSWLIDVNGILIVQVASLPIN